MSDFLSDILTRLRNASKVQLQAIHLHPSTPKYCLEVLNILEEQGYIRGFSVKINEKTRKSYVEVILKYDATGVPAFSTIFRVSTPGRRVFVPTRALWRRQGGRGIFILSTPSGIITDSKARQNNIGGEVLCGIY